MRAAMMGRRLLRPPRSPAVKVLLLDTSSSIELCAFPSLHLLPLCCPTPPTPYLAARDGSSSPSGTAFERWCFARATKILLQSRDEKPMNRYFPELTAPLAATLPERCVADGEIVIVGVGGLDFETLLLRIHPAASRGRLLSAHAPASFVAWDLLALGDDDLRNAPLAVRRERLEHVLAGAAPPVHLSGCSRSSARTGCGFKSMHPRFTIHRSCAASRTTISRVVRPDGKRSSTVSIHSGRCSGARFWKNGSLAAPST